MKKYINKSAHYWCYMVKDASFTMPTITSVARARSAKYATSNECQL